MVKNKGFLPSYPSEVHMQRSQIKNIVSSLHPACTESDPVTGAPFKAEAIIANPPAYGQFNFYCRPEIDTVTVKAGTGLYCFNTS
jgi:hypothetical protein